jgi:hypothetical protein
MRCLCRHRTRKEGRWDLRRTTSHATPAGRGAELNKTAEVSGLAVVLVVTGDQDPAELVQTMLTQGGHDIVIAHYRAAVDAARLCRPDVIILDGVPVQALLRT